LNATAAITPAPEPETGSDDIFLQSGEYGRGLLETLLALKHKADRQQEAWDKVMEEQFGTSSKQTLNISSNGSNPAV
jgi:hypothetical protein